MGGRIGSYAIPYMSISEAISIITTVVSRYNGQIMRRQLATDVMKMAPGSGNYSRKLGTIKDGYGLLIGKGMLSATDLGQRIVLTKDPRVAAKAKAEAFLRYALFQRLFNRIGSKLPDDEALMGIIVEITKQERIEAVKKLPEIRKLYADGLQYLKGVSAADAGADSDEQAHIVEPASEPLGGATVSQLMVHEPTSMKEGFEEIKMGDVRIWLRPDLEDVSVAEGLLTVMRQRLERKSPKPKASPELHQQKASP